MSISSDAMQLVSYVNIFVVGAIAALIIQRVFTKVFPNDHGKSHGKSTNKTDERTPEQVAADARAEANVDRMLSTEPLSPSASSSVSSSVPQGLLAIDEKDLATAKSSAPARPDKRHDNPNIEPGHGHEHEQKDGLQKPAHLEPAKKVEPIAEPPKNDPKEPVATAVAAVTKPSQSIALAHSGHLAPEIKQHLIEESHKHFTASLDKTTGQLEHDLQAVTEKLAVHLDKLGSTVINTEMERYSKQLERLRQQAETAITGAQAGIDKHQAELEKQLAEQRAKLEAHMNEEIAAEKKRIAGQLVVEQQKMVQQIDAKLGDAVASFLMETLQHNVDLGAQNNYLLAMLDEHKDDFKQAVGLPIGPGEDKRDDKPSA